jgi:hypothetical protein
MTRKLSRKKIQEVQKPVKKLQKTKSKTFNNNTESDIPSILQSEKSENKEVKKTRKKTSENKLVTETKNKNKSSVTGTKKTSKTSDDNHVHDCNCSNDHNHLGHNHDCDCTGHDHNCSDHNPITIIPEIPEDGPERERILNEIENDPDAHTYILDVFGGNSMMKLQNELMHAADVFENGKQFADFSQVEIVSHGLPNTAIICTSLKNSYERAGGYVLFAAIRSVDGKRCEEPKAYIQNGIQTITMLQNGELGWALFKDLLEHLEYEVETDEFMHVESVTLMKGDTITH